MYLLIQKGFCIVKAIEDALTNEKFQLAFTLLQKVGIKDIDIENSEGRNLVHTYGQFGHKCSDLSLQ